MGQPDELHPGHFYNDWPPALARELKHRWDDYQAAQAKEDFSYKMPPVPTSRNAENYADSGVGSSSVHNSSTTPITDCT